MIEKEKDRINLQREIEKIALENKKEVEKEQHQITQEEKNKEAREKRLEECRK